MQIVTDQSQHTFQWDNTPWRVDQGGTGQSSFTPGALIYGNGTSPFAMTAPGTFGQVLQFNGSIPQWIATSSLGIVAQPAGSDGEIQFNDGGSFAGDAEFVWNKDAGTLNVGTGGIVTGAMQIYGDPVRTWTGQGQAIYVNDYPDTSILGIRISSERAGTFLLGNSDGEVELDLGLIGLNERYIQKFPAFDGVFCLADVNCAATTTANTWAGLQTFSKGTSATTTVNFGEVGDLTSHACFNTKDVAGNDVSFYIANGAIVVENNLCQ